MYFVYMFIGYIQNTVYKLLKINVWYDMIINKISATMFDVERTRPLLIPIHYYAVFSWRLLKLHSHFVL